MNHHTIPGCSDRDRCGCSLLRGAWRGARAPLRSFLSAFGRGARRYPRRHPRWHGLGRREACRRGPDRRGPPTSVRRRARDYAFLPLPRISFRAVFWAPWAHFCTVDHHAGCGGCVLITARLLVYVLWGPALCVRRVVRSVCVWDACLRGSRCEQTCSHLPCRLHLGAQTFKPFEYVCIRFRGTSFLFLKVYSAQTMWGF